MNMQTLPIYLSIVFAIITLGAVSILYMASRSKAALIVIFVWLIIQTIITLTGFYSVTNTFPPRFALLIVPPLIFTAALIFSPRGKRFIAKINLKTLTWIHILRVPVEFVLYGLFINNAIPQIMTFEGRNWDILSGISTSFIIYFAFRNGNVNRRLLLIWNIISLGLLINIVAIALNTTPFPFRSFPFIWLPCCVVPLVLFSHVVVIRRTLRHPETSGQGDKNFKPQTSNSKHQSPTLKFS